MASPDTSPAAARVLLNGIRSMTPRQRLDRVVELNRALDQVVEAVIRSQHEGELDVDDIVRLSALRHLDSDLVRKVTAAKSRLIGESDATE